MAAFEAARSKGKPEWRRMRIAVLKNRLLQMTSRSFDERMYGAHSFREFLDMHRNLVRVDGADVELLGAEDERDARARIRPDLWRAMMDYTSGRSYAWDSELQRARPAEEGDTLMLPTISREDMDKWRRTFADSRSDDPRVASWLAQGMGTKGLPRRLQGVWTGFVRDRIADRLREWLGANGIELEPLIAKPHEGSGPIRASEELRNLVLRCVAVMTPVELSDLRLSPGVVLRALRGDHDS